MVAERVSSFNVMTFSKHIFSRFCQMGQGQDENCRRLSSDRWGRTHPPGCHLADRMTRFFHTTDWAARRSYLMQTYETYSSRGRHIIKKFVLFGVACQSPNKSGLQRGVVSTTTRFSAVPWLICIRRGAIASLSIWSA